MEDCQGLLPKRGKYRVAVREGWDVARSGGVGAIVPMAEAYDNVGNWQVRVTEKEMSTSLGTRRLYW